MQMSQACLIFLISLQVMSCATILHGSTEQVEIFSTVDETQVYVNDVHRGTADSEQPLVVTIPKRGQVVFQGKKNGCSGRVQEVSRTIDPTTFLGLLIDRGLVSILFVDILGTNAFVRSSQSRYLLELDCST